MGTGISIKAMQKIIQLGFERGINTIYWCVSPDNKRAVKFYDKNGYQRDESCKALALKIILLKKLISIFGTL